MIEKIILRKEVKKVLLDLMFKGKIIPGQRISLPDIANKLEVSVTPVREALTQLTESGVVVYIPNRGFFVSELEEKEIKDVYQIIIALEALAIRNTNYSAKHIEKLKKIQALFLASKTNVARLKYDLKFHDTLIEGQDNQVLKKIIEDTRLRIFFYELEYMKKSEMRPKSDDSHDKIIKYLETGQTDLAIDELTANWILSVENIFNASI